MERKIIKFLTKYPTLNAQKLIEFCEENGITPREFSAYMYRLLGSFFGAGDSVKYTDEYNLDQLRMGIKEESEHTTNVCIAEKIARDHLAEIPDYYTRLQKIET